MPRTDIVLAFSRYPAFVAYFLLRQPDFWREAIFAVSPAYGTQDGT